MLRVVVVRDTDKPDLNNKLINTTCADDVPRVAISSWKRRAVYQLTRGFPSRHVLLQNYYQPRISQKCVIFSSRPSPSAP